MPSVSEGSLSRLLNFLS